MASRYLDLDAIQPDLEIVRLVSEKILRKHRVLPLVKRGKRLFVAVSDPTNLHSLDEVKFATGYSVEAIVVEEDKLSELVAKTLEQVDTAMPELAHEDFEMDALDVSAGEEAIAGDIGEGADVDDAPIVRFVNKVMLDAIRRGASDIHFEPYERAYRIRFRLDGDSEGGRGTPGCARRQARRAAQGHVPARYRRAARPAGRPHQDEDLEDPGDRLPREHLSDALRREGRDANSRSRRAPCSGSMRSATKHSRKSSISPRSAGRTA